jgi:arabinofuranan 3-O-arabinosyltransferase
MLTADRPGDDNEGVALDSRWPRSVTKLRLAAICLALTLLAFAQSSGSAAADTKLDLVVDPARFLRRSLTLWDPIGAAGQLQDQAYGYLFPMGPYFVLTKWAALQPWVAQRLWESAILVAAFLGVVRLSRLLGMGGFWPRVAAGLTYALAPRVLMELGVISAELLPAAALPWVLIPLVEADKTGSLRRVAARSGVALLFAGGINASATLAVLPVPVLWLLTRAPGPRRRALAGWFALAVALVCLWWAIPLVLLGKYSPPFLDWIESSTVTTSPTSLVATLRGVDHWQAYLGSGVWPGGWILVAAPAAIIATTVVAATGLAGLAARSTPHRAFLCSSLVVGLALVTLGHVATVGPIFAGTMRTLLDGSLAAFRNVHKFDPVVRLPLSIGVGFAMAALRSRVPSSVLVHVRRVPVRVSALPLVVVAVLGVGAVAITPALAGRVVPQTRSVNDPTWWRQAGSWLGQHAASGRALIVPGAAQPTYVWGRPRDDALQPYAQGPWTVRDGAPMTQPGYVRLLDAVDTTLAQGRAAPDLASTLARSGIGYVIVRNDLDAQASAATPLPFVRATLASSPGLREVARFGPDLAAPDDPNRLIDLGITRPAGAVQIYSVAGAAGMVGIMPASNTVRATGAADAIPDLVERGLGNPYTPVIFGESKSGEQTGDALTVVTDGVRRREAAFSTINQASATMTAGQLFRAKRRVHDYLPADVGALSTMRYLGIDGVRASTSGFSGTAGRSAANAAWAALDGDPVTAWRSGGLRAAGQWWQVDFERPVSAQAVTVAFASKVPSYPTRLRVTTSSGSVDVDVAPDALAQRLDLPAGPTMFLRLTELSADGDANFGSFGLASVIVPGISPSRTLELGSVGRPDVLAFDVAGGERPLCLTVGQRAACDPSFAVSGEEDASLDRSFTLDGATTTYGLAATLTLKPGLELNALLDASQPVTAVGSSVDSSDPRERPGAAVDGRRGTSWVAAAGDTAPTLTLDLGRPLVVRGLTLTTDTKTPAAAPTRVRVRAGTMSWTGAVPTDGRISFPAAAHARRVTVTVLDATLRQTTSSVTGESRFLPVGIAEIGVDAVGLRAAHDQSTVTVGCGAGLGVWLDSKFVRLGLVASRDAVLVGIPLLAAPCGSDDVTIGKGAHRLRLNGGALAAPDALTLTRFGASLPHGTISDGDRETVLAWHAADRAVSVVSPVKSILVVHENANPGWQATLDGQRLEPVTIDGWQQGWYLPAGASGTVRLRFTPQRAFSVGLIVGLVAVLLLVALALMRERRRRPGPPDRHFGPMTQSVVLLLACGALGGPAGLAVGVGGVVLMRRARGSFAWVAALPLCIAGLLEAWAPTGTSDPLASSPVAQLLCIASIALVLAARVPPRQGRENLRSSGRSMPNHETAATAIADPAVST